MNLMMLANTVDYSKPIEGFFDKLQFGGMMLALGMMTVFAVLLIIFGALVLFKIAFHDLPSKKKAKAVATVEAIEPADAPKASNDAEIVAVIAAAIAMAESESDGVKFRVVSFKRR